MKQKTKLAVAKILALHAEFTSAEISEAYQFIRAESLDKTLGVNVGAPVSLGGSEGRHLKRDNIKKTPARTSQVESILSYVSVSHPERLKALDELEYKLRQGKVFSSLDDIRKVALALDKAADLGKSRKDAIPKFVGLLAHATDDGFRDALQRVYDEQSRATSGDEGYLNLAKYLVRGGE